MQSGSVGSSAQVCWTRSSPSGPGGATSFARDGAIMTCAASCPGCTSSNVIDNAEVALARNRVIGVSSLSGSVHLTGKGRERTQVKPRLFPMW
jgi:hypothetical protein